MHDDGTPLIVAAHHGSLAIVKCLVRELGADVNLAALDGATPLYIAAQDGHLAIVQFLVGELGTDSTKQDMHGRSPLYTAASGGHLEVVRYLVKELGADVNQATHDGRTALMAASAKGHRRVAAYLIKNSANPQASASVFGTAADISRRFGAPASQIAYLQAKMHCTNPSCSGTGIKKCTGCKQVRYCGQECQLAHWSTHKAMCKQQNAALK
jgi:ankyrin repeat protein